MGPARIVLAAAVAAAVTACSGTAPPAGSHPAGTHAAAAGTHAAVIQARYYLALGDSLSQGVQPDAAGVSVETSQGYADQAYAMLRSREPGLRLVKLGCPGETTSTMINGGICRYPGGSQLAAATAFLRAHRGRVFLVTIDIGANDPEDCGGQPSLGKIVTCFGTDVPGAVTRLGTIMSRLRAAAGPRVRIVGMSYYLPALAEWRDGRAGRAIAWLTEHLAAGYNDLLERVYASYDARVANVFATFDTADFGHEVTVSGIGTVPRNVAMICRWTWECAAPPRGPNQHADQAGYGVIAGAFLTAAGLS